ncbi:MAG: efflux RND transporter permease subunit [Alphaproteobacteria bacterium]|nr:efflux RND transporter permease subunit [Alphaproteobacteria bacterium]
MNFAKLALDNSRITICAILLILIGGISIYLSYPSTEDPTIQIRSASVTANYPGMSPERVEELITKPIESAMREIAEIKDIISTSKAGGVKVKLQLYDNVTDLAPVFQKIRNKANDIQSKLPEGTSGPFVHDDEGLTAVATIALWADGFSMTEMRDVAHDARDLLYTLDDVRKIEIMGAQEERIYLEVSPSRLAQLGVSLQDVFGALEQQNIIKPGGEINADGRIVLLEPSGNFTSVDAIRNVVFQIPDTNQVLRLGEIVTVRRELVDPPTIPSFFNDRPAIILSVSTVDGANNVEFGSRLTALLDDIQQDLPIGYVLEYATFQPKLIATAVNNAVNNVYQTLAIVLVVVMVFLGVRTGLIVGFFVPLTMLLGIIIMSLVGVELQRMSIAATIISLGMLVDNGIVVAEDIRVRLERGAARWDAATESGRTLAIPLLTSSLTTIFAFSPMLLVDGGAGEYVRSLAQVVTILLLGSWFLSMTVTPAMCAWFMRVPEKTPSPEEQPEANYNGFVYALYRRALGAVLKWRLVAIAVLVGFLVLSVQLLGTIRNEFFPLGDRSQFLVYLDFEAGTDIRETQTQVRKLTGWLADKNENPEITTHVAYIGYGGPRFFLSLSPVDRDPQRAFVLVNTQNFDDVEPVLDRVNAFLDANIPGAQADAKKMWFGGTEPGILQIRLVGPDGDILADRAERLISALHDIPGSVGIKQDWENKTLNLIVDVDQVRARRAGVTSTNVAESLNTVFAGRAISDYREGDKSIPIVVRGEESMRDSLSSLQRILVYSSATDSFVTLEQVATVRGEWRFSRIKRRNQQRTLTVEARNLDISTPNLLAAIAPTLDALDLPAGYRFEIAGELKDQNEANSNLFGFLPLAIAAIVLLLIGQFNSIRKASVILATVPLILIGGTLGLLVMNAANGFMVLLGFFSLAGILINNGIVLVDRIETELKAGREPLDAVIAACLARLRPILMTTLTTVLGLVPLILFGGALFYGMASVIAFGLVVATLITLGFVPALYTLLFRIPTRNAPAAARNALRESA